MASALRRLCAAVALALLGAPLPALGDPSLQKGRCSFAVEPVFPGYFVDSSCKLGDLGCLADGHNVECRFCGGGAYASIPCAPEACKFANEPFVPYYWEPNCKMGMLGCWADGVHAQCRFCGSFPYTSIDCPAHLSAPPNGAACAFNRTNKPETPFYWEPGCKEGVLGCLADGTNLHCRYCGKGAYENISCPASQVCTFANEPTVPYFWDSTCSMGKLGCMADGVHPQCRYCAKRPFTQVACPSFLAPPSGECFWPEGTTPKTEYFWDEECDEGLLGCWADGVHRQCRFCGSGVYSNVTCPVGANWSTAAPSTAADTTSPPAMVVEPPAATANLGTVQESMAAAQLAWFSEFEDGTESHLARDAEAPTTNTSTQAPTTAELPLNTAASAGPRLALLLLGMAVLA